MDEEPRRLGRVVAHVLVTAALLTLAVRVTASVTDSLFPATSRPGPLPVMAALLPLLVVVLLSRYRARAAADDGLPFVAVVVTGAFLAYLALPEAWRGVALFGWQVTRAGPWTFTVDLLAWVAGAAVGVLWGTSVADQRSTPRGVYRATGPGAHRRRQPNR